MKINTTELRKLIREELQKVAAPMLKELVRDTLLKNSINEVLLTLIAEAIVDKQEAMQLMKEQIEINESASPQAIRMSSDNLVPQRDLMPQSRLGQLTDAQRREIKAKYEAMTGGLPQKIGIQKMNAAFVEPEQPSAPGEIDTNRVIQMLPETDIEGHPLRLNALPEHLATALTKDYRQTLKNMHAVVNRNRA